jgi:uncharacterized membrane protein
MTSQTESTNEVGRYLHQLSRDLRPLPRWYRREILASMRSHLAEQGHPERLVPEQLGSPVEIARAAKAEYGLLPRTTSRSVNVLLWTATGLAGIYLALGFITAPGTLDLWWGRVIPVALTLTATLAHRRWPATAWWAGAALLMFATIQTLAALTVTTYSFPLTLLLAGPAGIAVSIITAILTVTAAARDLQRPVMPAFPLPDRNEPYERSLR